MEKFTVDLDKVIDDFDFNAGHSEQGAAASAPPMHSSLHMQCGISTVYHQPQTEPSANSDLGLVNILDGTGMRNEGMNLVRDQTSISSNIDSIRKPESMIDNLDSINHFYTYDNLHDDKMQYKHGFNLDVDQSPLTIHNDISQKLLQKQPNDNILSNQTSYNKILNQPSMQAGISSVYNHADYMAATSSSFVNTGQSSNIIDVADSFMSSFAKSSSEPVEKCSIDDLLSTREEDLMSNKKECNSVPPKYQNILLPTKLDTCIPKKTSENNTVKLDPSLGFSDFLTQDNQSLNYFEKSDNSTNSLLSEPEHVYENVYIGTDIPKAQDVFRTVNEVKSINSEVAAHTYENINFEAQNKDGVYECIYVGNRENLPETNTELEIAAKKMIDQLNLKESEPQTAFTNTAASSNTTTSIINPTKLVFQNVQLDHPPVQVPEAKSVIGFPTIDDMSEEELNKYLAELEAEERATEGALVVYENISSEKPAELKTKPLSAKQNDEDANEAPIFEAVTIGELPQVSQEDLQEKAKKFPVIDYSLGSSGSSGESSREFSTTVKKTSESSKISMQVTDDETKIKVNKKTHEKVRKCSDNSEPIPQKSSHRDDNKVNKDDESDKENGNYLATNDSDNNESIRAAASEENKNLNCSKSSTSKFDNVDNKNMDDSELKINNTSDDKKLNSRPPVRNTETISRFSVTRNVDVNDKLGCRSYPSQAYTKTKTLENNVEHTDSSDDDPNRPVRPQTLDVTSSIVMSNTSSAGASYNQESSDTEGNRDNIRAPSPDISENSSMESGGMMLGKQPPFWVPDSDASNCMLCDTKFTVVKRRHHCRACGKVLCSKCCSMKFRLEYQNNVDSRVCIPCHQLLSKAESDNGSGDYTGFQSINPTSINSPQLAGVLPPPPTVMVPVGVLKREGSTKPRSEGPKSVMFSDGIRPGCDLTELDTSWDWKPATIRKNNSRRSVGYTASSLHKKQNCPPIDLATNSYIPHDPEALPPTVTIHKGQIIYQDVTDISALYATLKNECKSPVMFAINRNLYAYVKIVNLNCCVNRTCWNVTSKGLACVGQDEIVFLVETMPDETEVPKDLLLHINQIYHEATKGNTLSEYAISIHQSGNLLGSREHAGFLFIRQTLQCLQKVIVPPAPFLFGLLVHRWETPWAKVFPLRLVLRLGAEYRYYPCPLVSVRFRDAVYFEIGHTVMKVLADFRNFTYTLPKVQGLTIHMQDRTTMVRLPKNRYNQVIKGVNNSDDHVLVFAANFSIQADSHLVCMQTNSEDESTYQTQAINIQNKPRKVTGASFIIINGALKSSAGLSANSSILEDGLMVQIMPEKMEALKATLKNMQDFTIGCGRQGAPEPDEIVNIKWVENDTQFNLSVKSPIDNKPMDGIPSIRVHNGINFVGTSRFIRWTEVFIIKSDDDQPFGIHYPVDINKLSESIARATCAALVKLLDLLVNAGLTKIAVRTTISPDNVGYEAGSEGTRLPPIYMNSLDNELIQVLQKAVQGCEDTQTVLELIFYVLETDN
ncbi:uncharacterized protein LOC131666946 isoform X3 [Phymastichus coffea]|uniref:uncharacterized protein LOC131666946 isoform X3 n=1 Tax=Phymastichus coffea TaxID=108790 RepID=UPI00273C587E|nr:uncharacterized protein LOC131666946 isoform X3 [Phymastichus coffea]